MAQVLNYPGRAAGVGQMLGSGLGQGIGEGLSKIVQNKVNKVEQNRLAQALMATKNFSPEQAQLMSLFQSNPEVMQKMMGLFGTETPQPMYGQEKHNQPVGGQQQQVNQQQLTSGQPQIDSTGIANLQKLMSPQRENKLYQNPMIDSLMKVFGGAPGQQGQPGSIPPISKEQIQQIMNPPTGAIKKIMPEKQKSGAITIPAEILSQIEPSPLTLVQPATGFGLTAGQRAKQNSDQINEARKEQHAIDKDLKSYIEMLDDKGGIVAKVADNVINRMEKLIDSGKLTGATMYNIRKKMEEHGGKVGAGLGAAIGAIGGGLAGGAAGTVVPGVGNIAGIAGGATLGGTVGGHIGGAIGEIIMPKFVGTKEDQEFTKLSLHFLNNLKALLGARITQGEIQLYMNSIPTLALDDDGKRAVIRDMKLTADGWRHQKQVKDEIIKANGNRIPRNLAKLVEEASAPYMDELSRKFTEGSVYSKIANVS